MTIGSFLDDYTSSTAVYNVSIILIFLTCIKTGDVNNIYGNFPLVTDFPLLK